MGWEKKFFTLRDIGVRFGFYSSLLKWVLGPHVIGFPSIILGLANIFL
jgi:hypothetical protein